MKKRSLILALAAGLIATGAFTAPCNAGSVTTVGFFSLSPSSASATEWQFTYAGAGTISGLMVTNTGGLTITNGGGNGTASGATVTFLFNDANKTTGTATPTPGLQFTFTDTATGLVTLSGYPLTYTGATAVNSNAAITSQTVPEPASLALLGIGMTGFLAFRRFLKRSKVA